MAEERRQREQRFERRMSDAEALMWNVEKDPWLNPNGGTLVLLDRPPDLDHFRAQLAATVATVPRLRERVVAGVGRLSPPVWRPDPEFDLDYHIREVVLPGPGSERQLLDLVGAIYQDPYDRTRPLWMFHIFTGLKGGRAALVWKIHHAVADGIGAGRLAESYLQPTRKPPTPPDVDLETIIADAVAEDAEEHGSPSFPEAVLGTITHTARRQAGIARRALGEMAMLGADPLRGETPRKASPARCARCAGRSAAGQRPKAAAHPCGDSARAGATSRSSPSRWTRRWRRRRVSAAR